MARRVLALLVLTSLAVAGTACGGDGGGGGDGDASPAGDAGQGGEGRGGDGDGDGGSPAAGRPYGVETVTETFVDDSRPVDDPEGTRNAPERTLATDIYVPDGEGPFPLVVHAHGFDGNPGKFTELLTHWAEAGYVVVAPMFPLTNDLTAVETGLPGILADYVNQPADVTFVIDQVLELAEGDHPLLGGRVDPEHIGVSGHSLGGATSYGLVFNDCCRDDRVDAVVLMSTLPLPFEGGEFTFEGVPVLLLQLTGDPIVPYDEAVSTYEAAGGPKFLVSLDGGGHFEPYENAPSPFDQVVHDVTLPFWDGYLADDPDATDRLVEAAESADQVRIEAAP
jgi:dienelactone hydrolase